MAEKKNHSALWQIGTCNSAICLGVCGENEVGFEGVVYDQSDGQVGIRCACRTKGISDRYRTDLFDVDTLPEARDRHQTCSLTTYPKYKRKT